MKNLSKAESSPLPSKVERMTLQECKDQIAYRMRLTWGEVRKHHSVRGMETTMSEVAKLYASQFKSPDSPSQPSSISSLEERWVSTKDRLPDRVPNKAYSQVQCLVNKRYEWKRGDNSGVYYQVQILTFNHEHECWDGEDGDDHDCHIYQVTHWQPLPEPPVKKDF